MTAASGPLRLPVQVIAALERLGLASGGDTPAAHAVTGGVSSEIWRVELPGGTVCVKRALARLRVEALWEVPTSRTEYEARWMRGAAAIAPGAVCDVLGFDPASGTLVLEWLPPGTYTTWKSQLAAGHVDAATARVLGERLASVHAGFAERGAAAAAEFGSGELFHRLRLEPYLLRTAIRHPLLAERLRSLASITASTGRTVIHGDVSPKNVLVGPDGPLLVDAECATWGDPAFDLAFCTNHLLLKAVWHPGDAVALRHAAHVLVESYASVVDWEPVADVERRAGALLPALALARVDGASPVEYLDDRRRRLVRAAATVLLQRDEESLRDAIDRWMTAGATTTGPRR